MVQLALTGCLLASSVVVEVPNVVTPTVVDRGEVEAVRTCRGRVVEHGRIALTAKVEVGRRVAERQQRAAALGAVGELGPGAAVRRDVAPPIRDLKSDPRLTRVEADELGRAGGACRCRGRSPSLIAVECGRGRCRRRAPSRPR